ncbi:hypothetical protein ACE6H2_015039 [Prunus campanulata]
MHRISTKIITRLGFHFVLSFSNFVLSFRGFSRRIETLLTEALCAPNLSQPSSLSAKALSQPSSVSSSLTEAPVQSSLHKTSSQANLSINHVSVSQRLSQPPLLFESAPLSVAAIITGLISSSSCRLAGNFWSRLQLPAAVLPLSENAANHEKELFF